MVSTAVHDGFGMFDAAAVALYMTITAAIAWRCSRRQGSTEEFFLGGRRMPWFAVGLSIMATLMSTISYLAVPGEMIQHGAAMAIGHLAIPLCMIAVLLVLIPFYMRLRLTSAYEYLEQRFDYPARLLGVTLFVLLRLGWLSVVIYTSSMALERMIGIDQWKLPLVGDSETAVAIDALYFWIALIGLFTTIYTTLGGIRAVIWTDAMQSVVMFSGTLITIGYIALATGAGPAQWWESAAAAGGGHTNPPLLSFDVTVRATVLTTMLHVFFWTICTHGSDQMVVQRYLSTSSLSAARRSYVISAVTDVSVGFLLAICGLALLAFYLQHPANLAEPIAGRQAADQWFPYFIAHQLPPGLGGVILAALFAAAMSSISSGINSVTAVVNTDILARAAPLPQDGRANLVRARRLSLAIGLAATLLACGVGLLSGRSGPNIMELMAKGFNMFLGPLAALFFIGMFLPRCSSRSAVPAVLTGMAVSIGWSYWKELGLYRLMGADAAAVPTFTLAVAVPLAWALLLAALLGYLVEPQGPRPGSGWTWWAIMRQQQPGPGDQEARQ